VPRVSLPRELGPEIERVLGGGVVPGALVFVGGDPGVGKNTLLLQLAGLLGEQASKTTTNANARAASKAKSVRETKLVELKATLMILRRGPPPPPPSPPSCYTRRGRKAWSS